MSRLRGEAQPSVAENQLRRRLSDSRRELLPDIGKKINSTLGAPDQSDATIPIAVGDRPHS